MFNSILILKYIFIFLFLGNEILRESNTQVAVIVTLIIAIASNLRYFYIDSKDLKYRFLLVEILLITMCTIHFKFAIIFYVISVIIDLISSHDGTESTVVEYILLFLCFKDILVIKEGVYLLFMTIALAIYIMVKNLRDVKKANDITNELYDKLRVSDDKLKKLNSEIEQYSQSALEIAVLKERNRISREVHDGVGHVLSTTMIQLSAMERIGKMSDNPLGEMAGELRNFVGDSFNEVKTAIRELKPDEYSDFEGVIRISELCSNVEKFSGIKINLTVIGDTWTFEGKQVINIYGVCKEILSNAVKHSKASKIQIVFKFYEDELLMTFKDDGVGVAKIQESGVGLKSIRERIKEINGSVFMKSKINDGMFTKIIVPKSYGGIYGED